MRKKEWKFQYEAKKFTLAPRKGDRNLISPDNHKRPVPTTLAALRAPALRYHQAVPTRETPEPSWPPHSNLLPSTLKELAHQANQAHLPSALQKVPSVHVFPLISSLSRSGEPRPSMAPAPRAPPQRPVPPPSHLAPPSAPLTPPYRRPELAKTWRSSLGRFNTCLLRAASCPSLTSEALTSK